MILNKKVYGIVLFFVLIASLTISGCSSKSTSNASIDEIMMASLGDMPGDVQSAPVTVQQAYQFAVANPATLQHIPCYCGCGNVGHTSNYSCYVQGKNEEGSISFDTHALGCSICVDITQDVIRLQKEGKTTTDIRTYIDSTYSQYGPSNIP